MTEEQARDQLVRIIDIGMAAEFMRRCVFDSDFYTWNPDGTLTILPGELLDDIQ